MARETAQENGHTRKRAKPLSLHFDEQPYVVEEIKKKRKNESLSFFNSLLPQSSFLFVFKACTTATKHPLLFSLYKAGKNNGHVSV